MINTKQLLANPGCPALVAWVTDPHSNPLPPPLAFFTEDGCKFYIDFPQGTYWFEGGEPLRIVGGCFRHSCAPSMRVGIYRDVDLYKYAASQQKETVYIDTRAVTTHAAVDSQYLVVGNRVLVPSTKGKKSKIRYVIDPVYTDLLVLNIKQHIRKLLIRHLKEEQHSDIGAAINPYLFTGNYVARIEKIYDSMPQEMAEALHQLTRVYTCDDGLLTRSALRELKSQAAELDRD